MNCEEKLKILMDACEKALMYGWEDNFNVKTDNYGVFWDEEEAGVIIKEAVAKVKGDKNDWEGLIITGSDADLLSRVLSEVKTKSYEESDAQLDDVQALDALVSCFRSAESDGKERCHSYFNPWGKRLVLGTIIGRQAGVDARKAWSL
jgi:hypothetical protein